MRSNVIKRDLHFIYNVRVTLQNQFHNIFAYAAVKVSLGRSLVCGVTIRSLIIGGLIAGRNGILVESLLQESNFKVSVMLL